MKMEFSHSVAVAIGVTFGLLEHKRFVNHRVGLSLMMLEAGPMTPSPEPDSDLQLREVSLLFRNPDLICLGDLKFVVRLAEICPGDWGVKEVSFSSKKLNVQMTVEEIRCLYRPGYAPA